MNPLWTVINNGGSMPAAELRIAVYITHEQITSAVIDLANRAIDDSCWNEAEGEPEGTLMTPGDALKSLTRSTVAKRVRELAKLQGIQFAETMVENDIGYAVYRNEGGTLAEAWSRAMVLFPEFAPEDGATIWTFGFERDISWPLEQHPEPYDETEGQ